MRRVEISEAELQDVRQRAGKAVRLLKKHYPDAKCSLDFKTVHQLMVATILSAQCTDERVNQVTPALFRKYRSVRDFADADLKELGQDVYATGFHNNKARAIKSSARALIEKHGGRVPGTLDELVQLPGVGRKTASVILGAGYGLAEGIVVDTHVARISRRLGFTAQKDPFKIEKDLMRVIPKRDWIGYAYMLIYHGRTLCIARRPKCKECFLNKLCPSAEL
ncbi:MAG: endonuclease III [Candidatus Zixiibacteriota bacterium]